MRGAALCILAVAAMSAAARASALTDFNQGIAAHNSGDDAETVRLMSLALSEPGLPAHLRPAALLDRATAYARADKYDLALADLDACAALTPGDYTVAMHRGGLFSLRKEWDKARADFGDAIRARPERPTPYIAHAETFMQQRRFDDAVKDYSNGLAAASWEYNLYALRGDAYRHAARYADAARDAERAIALNESFAEAYLLRGRVRDDSGDTKAALADYEKAHRLNGGDADASLLLGVAQWKLGQFDDAAHSLRRGPQDQAYFFIWGWLADVRRRSRVTDLADKAAKVASADWPAPVVKLIAGNATPDAVLAAAGAGDIDERRTWSCEADFYLGEWRLAQGDESGARTLIASALKACDPGTLELGAAKAELGRMR